MTYTELCAAGWERTCKDLSDFEKGKFDLSGLYARLRNNRLMFGVGDGTQYGVIDCPQRIKDAPRFDK